MWIYINNLDTFCAFLIGEITKKNLDNEISKNKACD